MTRRFASWSGITGAPSLMTIAYDNMGLDAEGKRGTAGGSCVADNVHQASMKGLSPHYSPDHVAHIVRH